MPCDLGAFGETLREVPEEDSSKASHDCNGSLVVVYGRADPNAETVGSLRGDVWVAVNREGGSRTRDMRLPDYRISSQATASGRLRRRSLLALSESAEQ
jgi:hypothetical protein